MNGPSLYQGGMTYREPKKHVLPYLARVREHERRVAAAEARGASAEAYEAAQTCPKLTKRGLPCQGLASKETGLCPGHQKQADAEAVDN